MSELEQWCEIDGHEWVTYYLEHGLILGPKTLEISKTCVNCKTTEHKTLVPYGKTWPLVYAYGNIIV